MKRVDANQPAIVSALRQVGYHVIHLHTLGKGVPDILVTGYNHRVNSVVALLVEIKTASGNLTDDEKQWHYDYPVGGPLIIARSEDDVMRWFGRI